MTSSQSRKSAKSVVRAPKRRPKPRAADVNDANQDEFEREGMGIAAKE